MRAINGPQDHQNPNLSQRLATPNFVSKFSVQNLPFSTSFFFGEVGVWGTGSTPDSGSTGAIITNVRIIILAQLVNTYQVR